MSKLKLQFEKQEKLTGKLSSKNLLISGIKQGVALRAGLSGCMAALPIPAALNQNTMLTSFYKPLSTADKNHNTLMELVDEISCNQANKINDLMAKLCEAELEIQELKAKLADAKINCTCKP